MDSETSAVTAASAARGKLEPKVRLADLVHVISEASDLMCPQVVGHHRRVAFITAAIARMFGLGADERRDVVLAAALHDCGAFSLRERLDLLEFETRRPYKHADAGYRLLRVVPELRQAAAAVRFHHVPWRYGEGGQSQGVKVPLGSRIIHLADRVAVLLKPGSAPKTQGRTIRRVVCAHAGALFAPELVRAFEQAAALPGFWDEAANPPSFREEELLGGPSVAETDLMGLARLFWQFVDFRSHFTATHTSGVVAAAERLADLCDLDEAQSRSLSFAAAMHDFGKLSVPVEILEKPGPLTKEEWTVMQRHPSCGFEVLETLPALRQINVWANYHHEKLSGKGYPFHLTAAGIPFESRIVSVADVFTALTEDRPYRSGLGGKQAIGIMGEMVGDGSLDPALVDIAVRHHDELDTARREAQQQADRRYVDFLKPKDDIYEAGR